MGHSHKTRYICLLQTWDSIDFPCGSPWKHLSARPLLRCREGALGQSLLPRTMAASNSQTFWKLESLGDGMLQSLESLESLESRNIRPSLGLWLALHLVGSDCEETEHRCKIEYEVMGMTPGLHGFHVHEKVGNENRPGDCFKKRVKSC